MENLQYTNTFTEEYTAKIVKELNDKKDALIKQRLIAKGLERYITDSPKRRFKRMMVEQHPEWEHWYADDGTEDGVLIISFERFSGSQTGYTFEGNTLSFELKYK
jgi:hypothetical protein